MQSLQYNAKQELKCRTVPVKSYRVAPVSLTLSPKAISPGLHLLCIPTMIHVCL